MLFHVAGLSRLFQYIFNAVTFESTSLFKIFRLKIRGGISETLIFIQGIAELDCLFVSWVGLFLSLLVSMAVKHNNVLLNLIT